MPAAGSPVGTSPGVCGRMNCQICLPVRASSARTSFTAVAYITPSTTSGVICSARLPPISWVHFGSSVDDVAGVDLIERAVAIRAQVAVVARPLARLRTHDVVERDLRGDWAWEMPPRSASGENEGDGS